MTSFAQILTEKGNDIPVRWLFSHRMLGRNYLHEIQKFTTSHYWNSGVRITTGVMVPMLIMAHQDWLSRGIPFLFGALFVSLTDTPGPIHHRRNGMLAAILINTFTVFITGLVHDYPVLLFSQVIIFSFFFSLMGIYGARAGAVGTLAMVVMLIHVSPLRHEESATMNALLTLGGGVWYATFSILLYRLQPYRLVDQALGENLMLIASYIRARGAFYKADTDMELAFDRVMQEQVDVLKAQTQMRELLFKTRQLVGDASPKSRSIMMIFLESLDLFEETMYSYQDYTLLQKNSPPALLNNFYRVILQVAAEFEHIGFAVQAGNPVKKMPALSGALVELEHSIEEYGAAASTPEEARSLDALRRTMQNVRSITNRLRKIVQYTRLEAYDPTRFPDQELEKPPGSEPLTLALFKENFTLRSNNFRYAIRISVALIVGFGVSAFFSLSHAYWVMLTIVTIMKPVYNLTRKRNIQRVLGTLGGVFAGSVILYFISNATVLVIIMIICTLMAYSLLRVNYLGFVIFLTTYVLITFHFLSPVEFRVLIGERMLDTIIGSVIAALAARFIFPVWQHYSIQPSMKKMLVASSTYFLSTWNDIQHPGTHRPAFNAARNGAIVALTNLSDNFQQMLAEPGQTSLHELAHQFVIASHTLTNRILSLSAKEISAIPDASTWAAKITDTLLEAGSYIENEESHTPLPIPVNPEPKSTDKLHPLAMIYSLANDIKAIAIRVKQSEAKTV